MSSEKLSSLPLLTCTIQVKQVRVPHLSYIFHVKNLSSGSSVWLVWGLADIAHVVALVLYYFLIVSLVLVKNCVS